MSDIVPVRYIEDGNGVQHPIQSLFPPQSYIEVNKIKRDSTRLLQVKIYNKPTNGYYLVLEQLTGRNSYNQVWKTLPEALSNEIPSGVESHYLPSYQSKIYEPIDQVTGKSTHYFNQTSFSYPQPLHEGTSITCWDISDSSVDEVIIPIIPWLKYQIKPYAEILTATQENIDKARQYLQWQADLFTDENSCPVTPDSTTEFILWNWETPIPCFAGARSTNKVNRNDEQQLTSRKLIFRFRLQNSTHHNLEVFSLPFTVGGLRIRKNYYPNINSNNEGRLWLYNNETHTWELNPRSIYIKI